MGSHELSGESAEEKKIKQLHYELANMKNELERINENYKIVVDDNVLLRNQLEETQKDLDETFHKLEGCIKHIEIMHAVKEIKNEIDRS